MLPRTDGGGALIVTKSERAKDFPTNPVYILGTGESVETRMVSQLESYTSSRAFRVSSTKAFEESGIKHSDVDHLMIYDAFAHLPVWGLEDLGFCERGEGPDFIWERNTAPGGKLPMNTSGGGLSYTHTGMYGMFACRRASVKCAVQRRLKSKVRRSVSAKVSAACLQPLVRSSSQTKKFRVFPLPFPSPVSGEGTHSKTRLGSFRLDEGSQGGGEMRQNTPRDGA